MSHKARFTRPVCRLVGLVTLGRGYAHVASGGQQLELVADVGECARFGDPLGLDFKNCDLIDQLPGCHLDRDREVPGSLMFPSDPEIVHGHSPAAGLPHPLGLSAFTGNEGERSVEFPRSPDPQLRVRTPLESDPQPVRRSRSSGFAQCYRTAVFQHRL